MSGWYIVRPSGQIQPQEDGHHGEEIGLEQTVFLLVAGMSPLLSGVARPAAVANETTVPSQSIYAGLGVRTVINGGELQVAVISGESREIVKKEPAETLPPPLAPSSGEPQCWMWIVSDTLKAGEDHRSKAKRDPQARMRQGAPGMSKIWGVVVALMLAWAARAQLRPADPAAVGMSAARLERASAILTRETEQGGVLAASLLVARREKIVLHKGYGRLSPAPNAPAVTPDTIFILASITKPVTACALMVLAERGQVSLDDPVSHYLPEFKGQDRAKIRVRDLLSHTSGLPDMLPEYIALRRAHAPLSKFVKHTFTTPLLYPPRTSFRYQSMGILLAAEIVERVSGMRLRDFEKREIFDLLGMKNSFLGMGGRRIEETAWCQTSRSENDEDVRNFGNNSSYWRDLGNPWGGMHSTTSDLAILLQTFLNGGTYAGKRFFGPTTVAAMTRNQNERINAPWGLGWALGTSPVWAYFGELGSPHVFGHVGATGTVAWADPDQQLLCVILTTRPSSEDGGRLLRLISNAVTASIDN